MKKGGFCRSRAAGPLFCFGRGGIFHGQVAWIPREEGGNGLQHWSQSRRCNYIYITRKPRPGGGELHLPEEPSTLAQYTKENRKDKGDPGRKLSKELGVAQAQVLSMNQIAHVEVYRGLCDETLT